MQLLGILKPDGTLRRGPGARLLQELGHSGLCTFQTFRQVQAPRDLIERHYEHIQSRSFYPWLLTYMTSGPSYVLLIDVDEQAIPKLRDLLGSTRAHEAVPGTLRYKYAPYGGANLFHISDSPEAAAFEVPLWRDQFSLEPGVFDMPISAYIQRYMNAPDNTQQLRTVCYAVADTGRPISDAHASSIRQLLSQECVDASADELELVVWTISEACLV